MKAVLLAWIIGVSLLFPALNYCYFRARTDLSPPIGYSHLVMGVAGELAHIGLCWCIYTLSAKQGSFVARNLFYVVLLAAITLASPLAVRHGLLRGNEDKPIFVTDPCLSCIARGSRGGEDIHRGSRTSTVPH